MDRQVIMVGSITHAMKGKEILLRNGIRAFVEKMPKRPGSMGCGYGIAVMSERNQAIEILTQNGIKVFEMSDGVSPP